jgi:hypothetical protein
MTTREEWLQQATTKLRETTFKQVDATLPTVRVSVGFPYRSRGGKKTIGQCWAPCCADDKLSHVFISPILSDSSAALGVLVHELVHACTPGEGHRSKFGSLARRCGLEGKLTATTPGTQLLERLNDIIKDIGQYPNAALNPKDQAKKQGTRLIKVECSDCGYTCRVSAKWLDEIGAPICPCNNETMQIKE